jgi:hypothetical protein
MRRRQAVEHDGVGRFLAEMRDRNEIDEQRERGRERLFALTAQFPKLVLAYLDSLPPGVERGDELLQALRRIVLEEQFQKKSSSPPATRPGRQE